MDNLASEHLKGIFQYMNTTPQLEPELKKLAETKLKEMFGEWSEAYDLMRTILAKCEAIHSSDQETEKTVKITVNGEIVQDVSGLGNLSLDIRRFGYRCTQT
jgi:hypothetical protein